MSLLPTGTSGSHSWVSQTVALHIQGWLLDMLQSHPTCRGQRQHKAESQHMEDSAKGIKVVTVILTILFCWTEKT